MATNYTLNDVAKIITDGKDFEAITEIGKRFPILAVKVTALATKAPAEFKDLMSYMPDHVTANKINKAIKDALGGDTSDEDVEDDTTDDEAPAEKPEKAVKKSVAKKKAEVTEKNEDGTYDYDSMNNAQMYKLLGELGKRKDCKEKMGGMSHDQMLEYLKKYGPGAAEVEDEEVDEDWGEEADAPADPYEGKTAVELFKECKKRGIKAPAKKSDKFYADLLRKADAEAAETEEVDDDEDGWEEVDIEEERKAAKKAEEEEKKAEKKAPAKKAPAKKAPAKAPAKKAAAKKAEPEDDDDDDWDI